MGELTGESMGLRSLIDSLPSHLSDGVCSDHTQPSICVGIHTHSCQHFLLLAFPFSRPPLRTTSLPQTVTPGSLYLQPPPQQGHRNLRLVQTSMIDPSTRPAQPKYRHLLL